MRTRPTLSFLLLTVFFAGLTHPTSLAASEFRPPAKLGELIETHCLDCHRGADAEGNLRLDELAFNLQEPATFQVWVRLHDRVAAGEMPPSDAGQPDQQDRAQAVAALAAALRKASLANQHQFGRVQLRRLNRFEYESTLRDLLHLPHLEVREMLPPDGSAFGFDNVGSALDLSYVQMSRYLDAADEAITRAMMLGPEPIPQTVYLEAKTNGRFSQVLNKAQEAVPVGNAVGLLRQPNTAQAPWWWSKFEPPVDGIYHLRMKSFGFIWDKGAVLPADRTHVVTFHAVQGSTKRPLGSFDVGRSESDASIHDFQAFLRRGDQIQIWLETLDDRNKGRQELEQYVAPGVAVEWLEVEGPVFETWPPPSYRSLFGELPIEVWTPESGVKEPPVPMVIDGVGKRARRIPANRNKIDLYHVVSDKPDQDAQRLLVRFAQRALRRPVEPSELEDVFQLVKKKLGQAACFQEAMRIGFQAILCSPDFLFLQEKPGRLDPYALASRLSFFLWSSMPDEELMTLARHGELSQPDVLHAQVERMLDDPKAQRFIENFTGQWLDLRRITITQPDEQLYPEFDQLLLDSMVRETHAYFAKMLADDSGIGYLVDSDFVMINERLATLYEIPRVEGVSIRAVPVPADSPRGGLLTQASVLKVTANGTTTSPVTRGAWVLDRIYGRPAPLPPPNVPAVEPDLRGTTTIRQQLDKHRSDAMCASCHRTIDPPGFALESFDVIGGWRDRYRSLEQGDDANKIYKNDRPVPYKLGLPVDPSGVAPKGQPFEDIHEFREILRSDARQLARNLVQRLLIYGTGAGIEFADRAVVDVILDQSEEEDFGLRTLIHAIVQSETFQCK